MIDYTIKECKADMIEMWEYLAEYPNVNKFYYLAQPENVRFTRMHNSCPCCEIADNRGGTCKHCPIKIWSSDIDGGCVRGKFSYYDNYLFADNTEEKQKYAKLILELAKGI